jgi:hypothetical protein
VWTWARQLWNVTIALTLAACTALEPTILGHGALIKSDAAAAFGALLFAYAAWRYWNRPGPRTLAWMTAALAVAVLTKFNLLVLVPVTMVLVLIKGPRLLGVVAIPLAVYLAILAAYQFQAGRIGRGELDRFAPSGIPDVLRRSNVVTRLPWPRQFVRGVLFVAGANRNRNFQGWMLGHRIEGSAPGYYPLAWGIKTPLPLQALLVAGLAALVLRIRGRKACTTDAFVWAPAALFFGTAVLSNYHIGIRHVLPALPFFMLAGGFALERWQRRWIAPALVALVAVSSLRVYPQGISYFNEWIGGPENGGRYLVDSNLDWGQNLPELGDWSRQHPGTHIVVYVFGLDSPARYMRSGSWIQPPGPGAELHLHPAPGVYAVSANSLAGIAFPRGYEDYLQDFRGRTPIARAGYSISIYEVK